MGLPIEQITGIVTAAAAVAFVAAACVDDGAEVGPGGARVDSAGITIWSASGDEPPAPLRLERVGGLQAPDTGAMLWFDDLAVDRASRTIYLLDQAVPRILAFDFEGRHTGEIGRGGSGPGEYESPTSLSVDARNRLLVMDPGGGWVHMWSPEGEYLDREPLETSYWGPGFAATPRGWMYTTSSGEETGTMIEALIEVTAEGADTLATVESHWRPLEMPCGRMPVPEVFSRSAVWGASDGGVAFASVPRYEVTFRRESGPPVVFRRDVAPLRMTAAVAEERVPVGPLRFLVERCGMTPAGVVRGAGFVEDVSPVFLLTVGPSGRVWAARGEAPTADAIDVFDPDEGFVGTIDSSAFPIVFLDEARYLTIATTPLGSVVEVWRVVDAR